MFQKAQDFLRLSIHLGEISICTWKEYAVHVIYYNFLNPSKTITSEKYAKQIDELHQKLKCLQLASFDRMGPTLHAVFNHLSHNQCFKSWTNRATKFCFIHHIHLTSCQLTTASSSTSTSFFSGEMLPQPAGGRKCFSRVCWIPGYGFLCYMNKQTYFSLAKMCWL